MFRKRRSTNSVTLKGGRQRSKSRASGFLLFVCLGFSLYIWPLPDVRAEDLYVSDNAGSIFEFNLGNRFTFATGLQRPTGIAFDQSGNLYAAESDTGIIYKFDADGNRSVFASGLGRPFGMTFDATGNLYVTDFGNATPGGGTIVRFTSAGVGSIFAAGLYTPTDLAFDSIGNLFVSDYLGGIVYRFTMAGGAGTPFATGLGRPFGVAIDANDNVFIANGATNGSRMITKFNQAGKGASFASDLDTPDDLAFDNKGTLFDGNDRDYILKFDLDGNATVFANGLTTPAFLAFGPESNAVPESSAFALTLAGIILLGLGRFLRLRISKRLQRCNS